MVQSKTLDERELNIYITWLENEIDRCLEYDLPFGHLEKILLVLKEGFCLEVIPTEISREYAGAYASNDVWV